MTDLEFLKFSYPYFSLAFELIQGRLQGETHLDIHVTLANHLLLGVEEATGIQPPETMMGCRVAEYYFKIKGVNQG